MVEASVSLTGIAIWGAAYTGLVRANRSKTIWRNTKTGRYSKPPSVAHRKGGQGLGIGGRLGKCPKTGISGEVTLTFRGKLLAGAGVTGKAEFELYPDHRVLQAYVRGAFGLGIEADLSLTGVLQIIEPVGTPENIFSGLGHLFSQPASSGGYSGDGYYVMPVV